MTEQATTARAAFTPELEAYADKLRAAGFTIYRGQARDRRDVTFFHYSREVDGQTCYGTVQMGDFPRLGDPLQHSMPIQPNRKDGSAILVSATWGDTATLGLDNLATDSVEYAEAVARPDNAGLHISGQRANVEPWGIGSHYFAEDVTA